MHLPSEILSQIFSSVPKSSLKRLRLACKTFYNVATRFLFNSIFVSARYADREIADSVASRFPTWITVLTFSSECYVPSTWKASHEDFQTRLKRISQNSNVLHVKQAKIYYELYCRLGSEQRALYKSGSVHEQLSHLLNTLPNLGQIIITDRRRRQDLSWFQKALIGETIRLRTRLTSRRIYKTIWTKRKDTLALAQLQTIQSVDCECFDKDPLAFGVYSGLAEAGSTMMPQNPWAMIMTALLKSTNTSIHKLSVQPKSINSQLPLAAIAVSGSPICHPMTTELARLTKLELRLNNFTSHEQMLTHPPTVLSTASNLRSLTIDIVDPLRALSYGPYSRCPTTFGLLLAGCKLARLSSLHLHNFTFLENDLSTFLQHSPNLRDLALMSFYMVDTSFYGQPPDAIPRCWERLLQGDITPPGILSMGRCAALRARAQIRVAAVADNDRAEHYDPTLPVQRRYQPVSRN